MACVYFFGAAELLATNENAKSEAKVYFLEDKKELECHHSQIPKSCEDATQLTEGRRRTVGVYQRSRTSLYLRDGKAHSVWKPKRHTERKPASGITNEVEEQRQDLHERQQNLLSRVQATRDVLKEQKEELARHPEDNLSGVEEEKEKEGEEEKEEERAQESDQTHTNSERRWQYAIKSVMKKKVGQNTRKDLKRMPWQFHDVVSQYIATVSQSSPHSEAQPTVAQERQRAPTAPCVKSSSTEDGVIPLRQWKSQYYASKKVKQERQERMKQFSTEPSIPTAKHLVTIAEEDGEVPSPNTATVEIIMNSNSNHTDNSQPLPQPDTPSMDDCLDSPAKPNSNPSNPQMVYAMSHED